MNTGLIQEFEAADVIKALKQMRLKKAPVLTIYLICFINIIGL